MNARMSIKTVGVLAGTMWLVSLGHATPAPAKPSGGILGLVSSASGIPQMGAAVLLYNRYDRLLQRMLTTEKGAFFFGALAPDVYTIRVSLASFLPALKRNIVVQPGMQSLLNVNLATVFSSIQLVAVTPGDSSLMSEEWKWVLRSASVTRPVLRFLPDLNASGVTARRAAGSSFFSSTRGVVTVSGGDQGSVLSTEPDLGTAFALATCFLGSNHLQVSGNFGYSSYSRTPTAAFRTSFRRELAGRDGPEVRLTMRQVYLPLRAGAAVFGGMQESAPVLRTLSATLKDETRLTDSLRLEYGFSLDSVTFLDRLNYASPYGRLTYELGKNQALQFSYASGVPPAELFARDREGGGQIQGDLAALALFPRISLRSGHVRLQRSHSWEAGYRRVMGSRTVSAGLYSEAVSNAAVTITGAQGFGSSDDLLPDVFSESWIFNAGRYRALGYIASLAQKLGDHLDAAVAFADGGALTVDDKAGEAGSTDDLRALLRVARRHSITARVSGIAPRTGTQFVASYQWADLASVSPSHMFLTQSMQEGAGLNLQVRQPIPYFGGLPGHLEATADLRNLLAQGYVPVSAAAGRIFLVPNPRSLRGGLSFIF
jgi:hypothetical protein